MLVHLELRKPPVSILLCSLGTPSFPGKDKYTYFKSTCQMPSLGFGAHQGGGGGFHLCISLIKKQSCYLCVTFDSSAPSHRTNSTQSECKRKCTVLCHFDFSQNITLESPWHKEQSTALRRTRNKVISKKQKNKNQINKETKTRLPAITAMPASRRVSHFVVCSPCRSKFNRSVSQ